MHGFELDKVPPFWHGGQLPGANVVVAIVVVAGGAMVVVTAGASVVVVGAT